VNTISTSHAAIAFDVEAVRARFSVFSAGDFTYFDAPAGSQVPDEVGDAIARQMREGSGNIGGFYPLSDELSALVAEARQRTAAFFGGDAANVVIGGSMTTLNFALTRAAARDFEEGDEIIVTRLDHEGSVSPWRELAADRGFVVKTCDLTDDLRIDLDHLRSLVSDRTRVIAFPLAANTVGSVAQASEIAQIAHEVGALAWVDAVHFAAHRAIDVRAIGADVILCSAYKFCGPHLGMAHVEPRAAADWRAYKVAARGLDPLGARFETGTLPYEQLAGLVATFDYLDSLGGFAAIAPYEEMLATRLLETLPPEVRADVPAHDRRALRRDDSPRPRREEHRCVEAHVRLRGRDAGSPPRGNGSDPRGHRPLQHRRGDRHPGRGTGGSRRRPYPVLIRNRGIPVRCLVGHRTVRDRLAASGAAAGEARVQEQHDDRADDRADDAGGLEEAVGQVVLEDQEAQEATDERADDAEQDRHGDAEVLAPRDDESRERTGDEADDDEADDETDHDGHPSLCTAERASWPNGCCAGSNSAR
jgi:cysteine desulfurase family protein (TIGR01976 family)